MTMAKKRSIVNDGDPEDDSEDEKVDETEDEEMSDDEDEEERRNGAGDGEITFLDSFYGLASASPVERARSAQAMLQHCLIGPDANTKDAAYAFRRLLNGICSGRAAARQGYASALTSFIKIGSVTGALREVQNDVTKEGGEPESLISFVRNQLLETTDTSQLQGRKSGKKKGSEERDYQFGRLFGILSIVRSGILLPTEDRDLDDIKTTTAGLVTDLIELYHHKKWMREPAAHGINSLMNSLYDAEREDDARVVVNHLVQKVIAPDLYADRGLDKFTAEQVAVAVNIQSHSDFHQNELPEPLNEAVISSQTIPTLAGALSVTSSVVYPRVHVVWDVLWLFLTEPSGENEQTRVLRSSCPLSNESAQDVVEAIMKHVVTESLLGTGEGEGRSNSTHERRALALCIVKTACGGQFGSSTAGPICILVERDLLENAILSSVVVRRLLLDVLCAGGNVKQGAHMLKPLTLHVLESILDSESDQDMTDGMLDRRLAFVRAFLKCDPRFDGRSKTATTSKLLFLNDSSECGYSRGLMQMWTNYVEFLEDRILRTSFAGEGTDDLETDSNHEQPSVGSSSHETLGYVDLLFGVAKRILRLQATGDDVADYETFQSAMIRRFLGFFMSSAFFDCSTLSAAKKTKNKKKARKPSIDTSDVHPVLVAGLRIKENTLDQDGSPQRIPYAVRSILSSRFFSLLADCVSVATSVKPEERSASYGKGKDARVLGVIGDLNEGWAILEERGAQRLASSIADDGGDAENEESVTSACSRAKNMQKKANDSIQTTASSDDEESLARGRCLLGCSILASTLSLHLLRCGTCEGFVDEFDNEDDDDDEEDDEEIIEMINELEDIQTDLLNADKSDSGDKSPLFGLAELCVHVLSSSFGSGSQSRGASPKLLREAVKFAWIGGLSASAKICLEGEKPALDDDVIGVLLGAIGASAGDESKHDGEESISDVGDVDESDESDGDEGQTVFTQAAAEALGLDEGSPDVEMEGEEADKTPDDDDDVELDPAQLESLLLEDSEDDDEGVLEHHAGADKALAQLIKLRQDARKAGRQALERLETARQLRCIMLVETLLSNPGHLWSNLLQGAVFLKMVIPLLQARKDLEKAIDKAEDQHLGKKSAGGDNEKRALLERLTSLLKTKVCKMRLTNESRLEDGDAQNLALALMDQVRKSRSTEHVSCCSAALLATLKNTADLDDMVKSACVYSDAVQEWSTKRTTKVQTSFLDDFVQHLPSLAQVVLVVPLTTATKEARSPFLKSESFRLLALLFNRAVGSGEVSDLDIRGRQSLQKASSNIIIGITEALQDSDMLKTKRVKDVLKAADKVVSFLVAHPVLSASKHLKELEDRIEKVKAKSESSGVTNICNKLSKEIAECLSGLKEPAKENGNAVDGKKKKKKKKGKR